MEREFPKGSEWRKWDLQVQTILDDEYIELSSYSENLKKDYPDQWADFVGRVGLESDAIKFDSKEYFFGDAKDSEKTRADNYAKNLISFIEAFHGEECCIALTDHNYDHPYLLDSAHNAAKNSRVGVLCGVEINVQGVHMLVIFSRPPYSKTTFSDGIRTFLSRINVINRKSNGTLTVCNQSYTEVLREVNDLDAVVIYPHCNSSNGLFQEKGKTDRTHLADQFNFSEFNILQSKNRDSCDSLAAYLESRNGSLKSGYCFTLATDARCLKDVLRPDKDGNFTWIKANPDFEGLRQIAFEHDLRVRLQAAKPEEKAGYQVIDRVELSVDQIYNEKIELNQGLNSIIGGRSTGKSILLSAIAMKLKTEKPVQFPNKKDYGDFVRKISSGITIHWKDGAINDGREIEFFQQGYMYEIARDSRRLSEIVQDILRQKGNGHLIEALQSSKAETKKAISIALNDLFRVIDDLKRKDAEKSERGDRQGIEDEIKRLIDERQTLNSEELTVDEIGAYQAIEEEIESYRRGLEAFEKDKQYIARLKGASLFREDVIYEFSGLSGAVRLSILGVLDGIKAAAEAKWRSALDDVISEMQKSEIELTNRMVAAQADPVFVKVARVYRDSVQLNEFEEKIKIQKQKLYEISVIEGVLDELSKQKEELINAVLDLHFKYFSVHREMEVKLSDRQDGLEIKAIARFNNSRYCEVLVSALNQQGAANQKLAGFQYKDEEGYQLHIKDLFSKLIANELTLKAGYSSQSLLLSIMPDCFYELVFDLVYEGDGFNHMSDGKKAFVVLKLLLDFSDKGCPIFIDQPEDDLDNRSIYADLVQYLKRKKAVRQIIVATHNPNIVVGADSELVIVANQNGIKTENQNGKKFEYLGGSLESSKAFDPRCRFVLQAQGIREHVCSVLEGGDKAFTLREKKYAIGRGRAS